MTAADSSFVVFVEVQILIGCRIAGRTAQSHTHTLKLHQTVSERKTQTCVPPTSSPVISVSDPDLGTDPDIITAAFSVYARTINGNR